MPINPSISITEKVEIKKNFMKITGQNRNTCGTCSTNFDSARVNRGVTARRYSNKSYATPCGTTRTFADVIELYVSSGPGFGETAIYVRGEGYVLIAGDEGR